MLCFSPMGAILWMWWRNTIGQKEISFARRSERHRGGGHRSTRGRPSWHTGVPWWHEAQTRRCICSHEASVERTPVLSFILGRDLAESATASFVLNSLQSKAIESNQDEYANFCPGPAGTVIMVGIVRTWEARPSYEPCDSPRVLISYLPYTSMICSWTSSAHEGLNVERTNVIHRTNLPIIRPQGRLWTEFHSHW